MPTLSELAHKGSTVTFIVPDRVKGGEQPTSHRKMSIKYMLKELYAAGVEKKMIFYSLFPMVYIQEVKSLTQEQFLERNYLMNSGIQDRLSATTVKIKNTW